MVNGVGMDFSKAGNFVLQSEALCCKVRGMNRTEAEEHLRVIRSLMEKATIYRAISAPTALVGGLASVMVGGAFAGVAEAGSEMPLVFIGVWLGVLAVTAAMNAFFIRREALLRGEPFVSAGMKMALRALLPSHLTAAVATGIAVAFHNTVQLAGLYLMLPYIWCCLYGMGLLSMSHFAPRSITRLGWAFLLAGLASTGWAVFGFSGLFNGGERQAYVVMAITFGLFHLIYAACTWPRAGRPLGGAGE